MPKILESLNTKLHDIHNSKINRELFYFDFWEILYLFYLKLVVFCRWN